jgi:hypothetical protein
VTQTASLNGLYANTGKKQPLFSCFPTAPLSVPNVLS